MMKKALHEELLRCHHKRKFYINIHEELLPVAWHPDRVYDWCFDEEEKGFWKKCGDLECIAWQTQVLLLVGV